MTPSLCLIFMQLYQQFFSVTAGIFFVSGCSAKLAEGGWEMKGGKQPDTNRGKPVPFLEIRTSKTLLSKFKTYEK